jgi:predicted flap endonuclease-1-like 5' DNA nuclease
MIYLAGQIVFWLILAVIFGFILGWYFRGAIVRKAQSQSEEIVPQKPIEKAVEVTKKAESAVPVNLKDDLQKISGIGPFLENRLNELGIQTFQQIAQWNSQDITRVSEQLQHFPKRIKRDNWVEQAKKLQIK